MISQIPKMISKKNRVYNKTNTLLTIARELKQHIFLKSSWSLVNKIYYLSVYVAGKPKTGCITRNETTPYQFQCVFSKDPKAKQDFSVYFHSLDQKQGIFNRGLSAFVISGFIGVLYVIFLIFVSVLLRLSLGMH